MISIERERERVRERERERDPTGRGLGLVYTLSSGSSFNCGRDGTNTLAKRAIQRHLIKGVAIYNWHMVYLLFEIG